MDIDGQTYPFSGIVRVGTWEYTQNWKRYILRLLIASLVGLMLITQVPILGLMALLVASYFGWKLYRAFNYHYYSLRLETGGVARDAVFSQSESSIQKLKNDLVSAIDNPPLEAMVINDPTFVAGDQVNVEGSHNTGKAVG